MATTLDPATIAGGVSLLGGNLSCNISSAGGNVRSTYFTSNQKFYFEGKVTARTASGYNGIGVVLKTQALGNVTAGSAVPAGMWLYRDDGYPFNNGTNIASIGAYAVNAVVMVAVDPVAGKLWFGTGGTWGGGGNPAAGTGPQYSNLSGQIGAIVLCHGGATSGAEAVNFGDTAYTYTPPAGFGTLAPAAAGLAYGQVIG